MFRKILGVAALLMATALTVPARAGMIGDRSQPDIASFGQSNTSRVSSTPVLMIDYDGDILPAMNIQQDLGESTRAFRTLYVGNIVMNTSTTYNFSDFFFQPASGNPNGLARPGWQGFSIATGTLVSTGPLTGQSSTYIDVGIQQSSSCARNITISVASSPVSLTLPTSFGAGIGTTTLIGCATFYGFDGKGNSVFEAISFSTANIQHSTNTGAGICQTQDCNANKGMGIGNVAFAYVSSFTIQITSITAAFGLMTTSPTFVIGWGQKLGLTNNIESSSDVYKITEAAGADFSVLSQNTAISIDPNFDTVVFANLPNGQQSKQVWYKIKRTR